MAENNQNPQNQGKEQKQEKFVFDPVTMSTNSKVDEKFNKAFANILAVAGAGGRKNLKKKKVANASIAKLVDEVYAEQQEAAEKEFKDGYKELMVDYQGFESETTKAYNAFVAEVAKRKEAFAERANALCQKVQNVDELRANFAKSASSLVKSVGESASEGTTSDDDTPAA